MRALLLALLVAACAAQTPPPAPAFDLAGTSWRRVDDDQASPHVPTIQFGADNRASGYDGCNQWFATLDRSHDGLRFTYVGTTRMACAEATMAAERRFLDVLAQTRSAQMDGEQLILIGSEAETLARFDPDS
jgi:heat shock protein HslJ